MANATQKTPLDDLTLKPAVVRVILWGTTAAVLLLSALLCTSYVIGNTYVAPRIGVAGAVLVYVVVAWIAYRRNHYRMTSWMMLALYLAVATIIAFSFGINAAPGILLFAFVIIVSGALLGSRYIMPMMVGIVVLLLLLQLATYANIAHTDATTFRRLSTLGDTLGHAVMLAVFAVVAWLSGRQMEQSLDRALKAESGLAHEKELLSVRLAAKTREVKAAQLEEVRQLYQFAELGQLGTVLLHDLANNLTALTLDIDDIGRKLQRNESIIRAKESIAYLETMVNGVRRQIRERDKPVVFDAPKVILETIAGLGTKARRAGVSIEFAPGSKLPFLVKGDPIRFTHILTILISNAIEAYGEEADVPSVLVTTRVSAKTLRVEVTDHGRGITDAERERLFKPFTSSKPDGMGIGLFMAREMIEQHFHGSLELGPSATATTFTVTVPRTRERIEVAS